jgi:hypothetical protein
LALIFDEKLTFADQTKRAITKTKQGIGMLCRSLRKWATAKIINTAISTIALPALTYGIEVWFPPDSSRQTQIIKTQKYAARLVLNDFRNDTSNRELTRKLNWQPIHHMVATRRLCRIKKYLDGSRYIDPEIFPLEQTTSTRMSNRLAEQRHEFQLAVNCRPKNAKEDKLAAAQSRKMWNALNRSLVTSPYKKFVTGVKADGVIINLIEKGLINDLNT